MHVNRDRRELQPIIFWIILTACALTSVFLIGLIINGIRVWLSGGYMWPRSAADWGAWAGWVGGLGTTGGLIFAGLSFRHEAKKHAELRRDLDQEARLVGGKLGVDLRLVGAGEEAADPTGVLVLLKNDTERSFKEVQILVPDVACSLDEIERTQAPALMVDDEPWHGHEDPEWEPSILPVQMRQEPQHWSCGDIGPHEWIRIPIYFAKRQPWDDWVAAPEGANVLGRERKGRIAVIYRDHTDKCWVRWTNGRRPLERLLPTDKLKTPERTHRSQP